MRRAALRLAGAQAGLLLGLLAGPAALPCLAAPGYALKRVADMADGAPAFVILGPERQVIKRIECIQNGWVRGDELAAQLLASTAVMAAIVAKRGHLAVEDLGPAMYNCVPVDPR